MKIKNISSQTLQFLDILSPGAAGGCLILSPNAEVTIFDEDAEKSNLLKSYINDSLVQKTGSDEPNSGTVVGSSPSEVSNTFSTANHSFQGVASDLTLTVTAGSSTSASPKFLAGMMGNVFDDGAPLTRTSNYLGGVIGHMSIVGTISSTYPVGAVLAGISDGSTDSDGAVVAYIDGDSAVTTSNAAFKVKHNNSQAGSGFNFGLDLFDATHDGYNAISYLKGEIRLLGEAMIFTKAGAPVNGTTGANNAGPGSLLIDITGAKLYINTNTKASPTWTVVGSQS